MPLFNEPNVKVAFIDHLNATFHQTQHQSGVHRATQCHFSPNPTSKWRSSSNSVPLFNEPNIKVAFIELLNTTFQRTQHQSGIHRASQYHFSTNPTSKWCSSSVSTPLSIEPNIKVAFIKRLNATFQRTQRQSGVYRTSQCHFSTKPTSKWRSSSISMPLLNEPNIKVAFIALLNATFTRIITKTFFIDLSESIQSSKSPRIILSILSHIYKVHLLAGVTLIEFMNFIPIKWGYGGTHHDTITRAK